MTRLSWAMAVLLSAPYATAGDKENCANAYTSAQTLRDAHKLIEARAQLRICSQSACAAFMQKDCTAWLGQVETGIPTVVFIARSPDGTPIVDGTVTVDGEPPLKLDAQAVELNPGVHEVTFTTSRGDHTTLKAPVLEGERLQKIAVTVGAPAPTQQPAPPLTRPATTASSGGGVRVVGIVVGAVGVATLLAGAALGTLAAVTKANDCNMNVCTPGTIGTLYGEATASTAMLVAGGLTLALGVTLFIVGAPKHNVTTGLRVGDWVFGL